jgi:hypothetical protein
MKLLTNTFETMFYVTPGLAVVSLELCDEEGERVRLGWSLTLAWLMWEVTVECYNSNGRAMMG